MSERVEVNGLWGLLAAGARLVEVLPAEEFREEHLAGAQNIPLKALAAETVTDLEQASPVVVYCHDAL